jgi:hypothetical protein
LTAVKLGGEHLAAAHATMAGGLGKTGKQRSHEGLRLGLWFIGETILLDQQTAGDTGHEVLSVI